MSSRSSIYEDSDYQTRMQPNRIRKAYPTRSNRGLDEDGNGKSSKHKSISGEFEFDMMDDSDNNNNDFKELRDSLLIKRRNSSNSFQRSEIQKLNYQNSPLLNLPTEVLLQIFHSLDRKDLFSLLTVCREFSELIVEILWFRPNMQSDASFKRIKHIMTLPPTSTHWNYRLFIKRLNLSFMTKLVDDELLSLFIGCPKLERLTLVNCTKLTHTPITNVLQNCEKLQSIDLTGVVDIHDEILIALANNCTRLQGLYAPGCSKVSELAILQLLKSCPMLKRVKFNNSDNITDETIATMYQNCKSLVEIDLHNCPKVTDLHLKKIFLDLSQLREFRISNASGITDKLFELLPNEFYLEKLRIIDITGCNAITDKLVEKLVLCAPRLRNVVLSKCMQITDASLRALSQLGRSLHYIHLGHCGLITDFGVASLVRSCHRIQYIDLACCSQLTDWTLVELANLPKLRRIGLVKCGLITDNGILELVRRRGEHDCLERVHLSYCTNLTIGPIYLLLKNCPKLTHLSLTGIAAFLRREITQYCRDPPPDFNEYQRSLFCVFSGNGVNQLRNHLNQIMEDRAYFLEQGEEGGFASHNANANTANNSDAFNVFLQGRNNNINTMMGMNNNGVNNGANANNGGANNAMADNNDDDMSLWARQRGLGILQANEMAYPEIQEINREIFRELNEGDMSLQEMREHFQRLIRTHHQHRLIESNLEEMNQRTGRNMTLQEFQRELQERQRRSNGNNDAAAGTGSEGGADNGTNAPQIVQPAVFPNSEQAIPVINDDDDDGDIEMQAEDLFPGASNNNGTNNNS